MFKKKKKTNQGASLKQKEVTRTKRKLVKLVLLIRYLECILAYFKPLLQGD